MKKCYFVDVDGNDVDVETELYYLHDRLEIMSILFDRGLNKGFSDAMLSTIGEYIISLYDCSTGLVKSLYFDNPSRQLVEA